MAEQTAAPKKNVYISLHESFINENVKYTDKKTGQEKSFNIVRLPKDTIIDGKNVGGFEFSPLYVNPSKFRGEHWRDIPLLADREVQLRRDVRDIEGNPIIGDDGKREKEVIKVTPEQIKTALSEARKRYAEEHAKDERGLSERAEQAKEASDAMEKGEERPLDHESR
ncbi:MAG TPA: DNA gyrase [Adlercreutzia equolifaciens]|uniref:DNA gyrase n=1 Tax=Adlercreutzia equolifaciens TaxID=446660 RepID=UPI00243096E9|nr:DNA gyrase [Adlercreutzia equolifaciens]HJI12107.1 DNA gyrase [Adlercreutzia equolifaciens]